MNIAIDISPLKSGHFKQHQVRGSGFYISHLQDALIKNFPDIRFTFFTDTKQLDSQVQLIHYPYFEPFFLTLPLKKKYKTVVTVHDLTPLIFPSLFPIGIKGLAKWHAQKFLLKNSDAIITDSKASKKDILRIIGVKEEKVHVAYLAASNEFKEKKYSPDEKEKLFKKYNLPLKFLLYVGDVTPNKNLPRLIEAVKQTDIPLVMVGKALIEKGFNSTNPWDRDRVTVQKAIDGKQIIALGFLPTEDVCFLYNQATAFVMPSLYEGFGLPVLEAMQSGCPVISSQKGSLSEVAGDASFPIDPNDIDNMKSAIQKVFESSNIQKDLVQKGFKHVKNFSWDKTARDTVASYQSIV